MNKDYIHGVKCVKCNADKMVLFPIASYQDEVTKGLVRCLKCDMTYPIIAGIPCFLLPELRSEEIKIDPVPL
jgi:uncharacterized protein YbaR (Trm112 family)